MATDADIRRALANPKTLHVLRLEAKTCIHYQSRYHNERCKAGVRFEDADAMTPGKNGFHQLVCFGHPGTCPKYTQPVLRDVARDHVEREEIIEQTTRLYDSIVSIAGHRRGESGTVTCPRCKARVRWQTAASNGHIYARCPTEGCIAFMQ